MRGGEHYFKFNLNKIKLLMKADKQKLYSKRMFTIQAIWYKARNAISGQSETEPDRYEDVDEKKNFERMQTLSPEK